MYGYGYCCSHCLHNATTMKHNSWTSIIMTIGFYLDLRFLPIVHLLLLVRYHFSCMDCVAMLYMVCGMHVCSRGYGNYHLGDHCSRLRVRPQA